MNKNILRDNNVKTINIYKYENKQFINTRKFLLSFDQMPNSEHSI